MTGFNRYDGICRTCQATVPAGTGRLLDMSRGKRGSARNWVTECGDTAACTARYDALPQVIAARERSATLAVEARTADETAAEQTARNIQRRLDAAGIDLTVTDYLGTGTWTFDGHTIKVTARRDGRVNVRVDGGLADEVVPLRAAVIITRHALSIRDDITQTGPWLRHTPTGTTIR